MYKLQQSRDFLHRLKLGTGSHDCPHGRGWSKGGRGDPRPLFCGSRGSTCSKIESELLGLRGLGYSPGYQNGDKKEEIPIHSCPNVEINARTPDHPDRGSIVTEFWGFKPSIANLLVGGGSPHSRTISVSEQEVVA
jgi:hypothetical protein